MPNKQLHADAQTNVLFVGSLRLPYHKKLSGLGAGEPSVSPIACRAALHKRTTKLVMKPRTSKCRNAFWLSIHNHAKQGYIADAEKQRAEAL